ncbi:hypothetical protein ACJX0J_009247, partial [Zea mays]
ILVYQKHLHFCYKRKRTPHHTTRQGTHGLSTDRFFIHLWHFNFHIIPTPKFGIQPKHLPVQVCLASLLTQHAIKEI